MIIYPISFHFFYPTEPVSLTNICSMQTFCAYNWKMVAITHWLMLLQKFVENNNLTRTCESTSEEEWLVIASELSNQQSCSVFEERQLI